jgi:hypothetical protein
LAAGALIGVGVALPCFVGFRHSASPAEAKAIALRQGLSSAQRISASPAQANFAQLRLMYSELTGRDALPKTDSALKRLDDFSGKKLTGWHLVNLPPAADFGIRYHGDGRWSAQELKEALESRFAAAGFDVVPEGDTGFRLVALTSRQSER